MKIRNLLIGMLLLAVSLPIYSQTTTRTLKLQGVEMVETMSDDGTSMIKRPYRWFAGIGEADVESLAVEMAQEEAYACISRVIENIVTAEAERAALSVNGHVEKALKSYWKQVSNSVMKACEPFGDTESVYDKETKMYQVTAKVGIRGDKYVKLIGAASDAKPENLGLEGGELKQFIDANNAIIDAAKGN